MGGDDQVPSRISGSDAQVREELVLDRSLATAKEVEGKTLSRPDCPRRRAVAGPPAIQTEYRSLTVLTSLRTTATSGLLSQMSR
jgi:hypothetical protein